VTTYAEAGLSPQRHPHIDAMRGYALLGVIGVHASQNLAGLPQPLRLAADYGGFSVQLFFVASALTLMLARRARGEGGASFLVRRLFRIVPMFWLAIAFYLWLLGMGPRYAAPHGIAFADIAATALLLHGLHPRSINSVVPGGWSIAAECMFYLLFPALVGRIASLRSALRAFVGATALAVGFAPLATTIAAALAPGEPAYLFSDFAYFDIVNQLPAFLAGVAAYFAMRRFPLAAPQARLGVALSLAGGAALVFAPDWVPKHIAYAACFAVFAVAARNGAGLAVNPPIEWLGVVSYSGYLWHFAVLKALTSAPRWTGPVTQALGLDARPALHFLWLWLMVVGVTLVLASITYLTVERPMMALGGRIARRLQARRAAPDAEAAKLTWRPAAPS
jgi:peptidoglycan/LPS O-acetylase OafA/YrhL